MNDVSNWQSALLTSWSQVWSAFLSLLPTLLGAILIFALGLVLAFWIKRLVIEVLKVVRFEKAADSIGVDQYLKKADIGLTATELVGTFVEWLIILVFFLTVVDILGLRVVSNVLTQVLGYVPNILAAALIIGAGSFLARLVDGLVRGALASVDTDLARPVGKLARWLILIIAFFAAIEQLQIAQNLIAIFFQGLTYTVVLVVGLSIGLGAKDLVSKVLTDWYDKVRK